MQQHSEFFTFAAGFWWLIFPVGWGLAGMMRAWLKHQRAQKALDLLATYAQQNREPPPEVLAQLRSGHEFERHGGNPTHGFLMGGIILAGIALAFLSLYILQGDRSSIGLLFVVIVVSGLAASLFVRAWLVARDRRALPPP